MYTTIKAILYLLISLSASACFAAERIEIVKSDGEVTVSKSAGAQSKVVSAGKALPSVNTLSTGAGGRAVVRVGNTGYLVLEKNSSVEINAANTSASFFRQLTGKIYYAVNTLKGKSHTLEVRTKVATIGVRGTRFLVTDDTERNEIGMRKGEVNVATTGEEFEVHKQLAQEEWEAMKQEAQAAINKEKSDFETYKENTQKEFVEYKRELLLGADRMLAFDGKRVDDRPLGGDTKADMESLENYAGQWLNKVKD